MMYTTPRRLITLHFSQRVFTDALTFMLTFSYDANNRSVAPNAMADP